MTLYFQGSGVGPGVDLGPVQQPTIVDGNPAIVIANTMNLSGAGQSLADLIVTLNISGGYNNGLIAWLVNPAGTVVTLMNQPGYAVDGFGATGAGMNITLQEGVTGHGSIEGETSGTVLSGSCNGAGSLAAFGGASPNRAWTLYFSDTLSGGGDATLNGWSLDITAVPEPVNVALAGFAIFAAAGGAARWRFRKDRSMDISSSRQAGQDT